ncbi:EAL domain-containing protein [Echinimonas agarilytica]|uniref:cyclic-guanylate-specific phosphodiesterase n=1 Tax=Echinimonas agarilytica TaxID=1215918 RepID=A0AA41W618_9GAMM|nr:EAL domain-containing protein [Echinimonas agarilytica]MCM2679228.1 EAL domain-containing protein [Echinimonas agarilytica]
MNSKRCLDALLKFCLTVTAILAVMMASPASSSGVTQLQQLKINETRKQTDVFSIVEDVNGFIWLGTLEGLYRFDGSNYHGYNYASTDPNSLSNNLARVVFSSSKGDLWVGTQNGLNRYLPEIDGFKRYLFEGNHSDLNGETIWGIFESSEHRLLVSTNQNMYELDNATDTFTPILEVNSKAVEIKSIIFQSERSILAATYANGLLELNIQNGTIEAHQQNDIFTNKETLLHDITPISSDQYWISTSDGVFILDRQTMRISKHHSQVLSHIPTRSILKAANSSIWVGTEQGLLLSQDSFTFKLVRDGNADTNDYIYNLFGDGYGNIWAGGRSLFGLHRITADPFQYYEIALDDNPANLSNILAIEKSSSGIWILTDKGELALWDLLSQQAKIIAILPSGNVTHIDSRLRLDPKQSLLWVSSDAGLMSLNVNTSELEYHQIMIGDTLLSGTFDFEIDSSGYIWIASKSHGLLRYDLTNNTTIQFSIPDGSSALNTLTLEADGTIWLGTEKGVISFNIENQKFQEIELADSIWVSSIATDESGIWLGTLLDGIFFLNKESGTTRQYSIKDGLTDNGICHIVPVDGNGVWMATNFGISFIDRFTGRVSSYNNRNSVQNIEFNQHAGTISDSGSIYLGGTSGFTKFHPKAVVPVEYQGQVQLENLMVFNEVILPHGEHNRLSAQISSLKPVHLLANDSPVTIEFSYPSPAYANTISYQYRLIDQDQAWLNTDSSHPRATYTNLSPGDFVFEVKAVSQDGLWESDPTQVSITVGPPLWRTPAAYVLYAGFLIVLFMGYLRINQKRNEQQKKVAESEERLKLSLWGSGDELWDWHISTGKIYRSNIWGLLEFPNDGRRNPHNGEQSNIHPRDLERVQNALSRHFDNETTYYEATYRVRNKSSEWIWILDRGKIVERDENNTPTRMTGTIKDISKLKEAEQRLTLFARSFANISDGVFILNRRFRVVEVNEAFALITGFNKNQVVNHSLRFRNYPPTFTEQVKMRLSKQGRWVGELEDIRQDGKSFYLELAIDPISSEEGDVTHYVGVFSDITRRKQTENELHRLSVEDTLTKLPNRSWFQAEHEKLVSKNTRHALMVFDLDNFKKVNDSLGHAAGDELLKQVAVRLNHCTRRQDTLFRLGGDEYAVLMEDTTDINTITKTVKNLQTALERPFAIAARELVVTCSIGVVLYPLDGESSEELLRNADTAMYHAKSQGSNGYVFFSSQMNQSAMHQLHIESLLRQAIRDDNFTLHFQPKFTASTNELDGTEALIRLHHPEHGPISPGEFIPLAEDNGLIIEIGDIVLRKACFAAEKWRKEGLMKGRIAVNVSARQFASPDLTQRIERTLEVTGLPAHCLELELTEGALVEDPEGAIKVMQSIRKIGVHISLDDFGTGYSSLAYLQRFPIDTLKIDQTFIRDLTSTDSGRNMVSSIIALAHNLNLTVVAEGVETEAERKVLTELECETLQGFLMSRPLNETDFAAFLHIQSNQRLNRPAMSENIHD